MSFLKKKERHDACPFQIAVSSKKIERIGVRGESYLLSDLQNPYQAEVIILTDMIERSNDVEKLERILIRKGIKNYTITSAIGCGAQDFNLPSPTYTTYAYCDFFKIEKYVNVKTVLCLGRALYYFTESSHLSSWRYFSEFLFNPTWFYPAYESKKPFVRIYPVGFLSDILKGDTFEYLHLDKQLDFIQAYLLSEKDQFIPPVIKRVENLDEFITQYRDHEYVAIDTETNSLDVFIENFKCKCITLSFDGIIGWYLPVEGLDKRKFSQFIKNKKQIYSNGKYDCKVFNRIRIRGAAVEEDTSLIFHLMNTERDSNSLKTLAWLVGFGGYENELEAYKKKYKIDNYLDIPDSILIPYAGLDPIVTFRLWLYAQKYLIPQQKDTYALYKEVVIPVIPVFQEMEELGILIDKDHLKGMNDNLLGRISELEKQIFSFFEEQFLITSNDDLGRALEKKGLPDIGRSKKGIYLTNDEKLRTWSQEGFKVADLLLEYRRIKKLNETYVGEDEKDASSKDFFQERTKAEEATGMYQYVMPDGRIHGTIMPALTNSWRSLSLNPNLQNIPRQGAEAEEYRQSFIPPEGFLIGEADYCGFQLRIGALYSKDETMKKIFTELSGDMHSITANNVFCRKMSLDEFLAKKDLPPYEGYRQKAKGVNFRFEFGGSSYSFQDTIRLEWPVEEIDNFIEENNLPLLVDNQTGVPNKYLTVADHIRETFFQTYPGLQRYIDHQQLFAQTHGYVESPIFPGCRRHLPSLVKEGAFLSKEKKKFYSHQKNAAVNSPVQGFEAISVYKALVKIHQGIKARNLKSRLFGCVHDSIVFYCHKDEVEIMYDLLQGSMNCFDYEIPITSELKIGKVWGFGKKVKRENIATFQEMF